MMRSLAAPQAHDIRVRRGCDGAARRVSERALLAIGTCVVSMMATASDCRADAEGVFANKCAGCHAGGGNVVERSATLFPESLERNGVNGVDKLYTLIYSGRNKMPGYGEKCAPKGQCTFGPRLTDEEVRELAQYVLDRSRASWK